ncbi:DUF6988 family protein [Ramlibacter sp. MMS24-I3-19]|uniref:DUF6988 family protein n=1 Tax=Ramlibacter sp. MMS24-I3-19 TaxID=3416606 RepID=UPI003CFCF657
MKPVIDASAADYLNSIGAIIHECDLPATKRVRAAASCLAIAQDHHHAIVALLDHELYASSFALVRVAFEAYVRGEWLALCATDAEVDKFVEGAEPPRIGILLESLEQTETFSEMILSEVKENSWRAMCAFTHTGGLHIQRWNTPEAIEPNYDDAEVRKVLSSAETIGALSVVGIASLAGDEPAAEKVLKLFRERMGA